MTRDKFLEQVKKIVCEDRNQQYGEPEDVFGQTADYWAAYLHGQGVEIDFLESWDIANMMILLKIARCGRKGPSMDTLLDIAGYAACAAELMGNSNSTHQAHDGDGI